MPDTKKPRLEIVVWNDAHASTSTTDVKAAALLKPILTYSVGFVVAENQHGVVLASDLYHDHPGEAYGPMFIPHGIIINRWAVALPRCFPKLKATPSG